MSTKQNVKISTRLAIGFTILLAILASLTAIGIYQVNQISRDLTEINDVNGVKQRFAIDMRGTVHDRAIALRDSVITNGEAYREAQAETQRLKENYLQALEGMREITRQEPGPEQEARILENIDDQQAVALSLSAQVIEARQNGNIDQARTLLVEQAGPAYAEWLGRINQFLDFQERLNDVTTDHARQAATNFAMLMFGLTLVALAIGAALAFFISRKLLRELGAEPFEVQAFSTAIGNGNLAVTQERGNIKEKGVMASQVAMAEQLQEIVLKVRSSAEAVASNSEQIAEGNHNLASRTEQQSSALAQTAAAMEELNSTVTQNAENAAQASKEASQAHATAARGGEAVKELATTMTELDQSSQEIAGIISTIDSIAFQTNILALNASVEAARAGEHGRGFAVVANEVRNLAQRSADAAQEINELISRNIERVKHGNERASMASRSTSELIEAIERVSVIMSEISSASFEQSTGVKEVNQAVSEMDQMTQDNDTVVHENASAANTLRHNARELLLTVQTFKLPSREKSDSAPQSALVEAPATSEQPALTSKIPALNALQPQPAWANF